jgi:hypothetical protein
MSDAPSWYTSYMEDKHANRGLKLSLRAVEDYASDVTGKKSLNARPTADLLGIFSYSIIISGFSMMCRRLSESI